MPRELALTLNFHRLNGGLWLTGTGWAGHGSGGRAGKIICDPAPWGGGGAPALWYSAPPFGAGKYRPGAV